MRRPSLIRCRLTDADWVAAWDAVRASRAWDRAIDATAARVARCLADTEEAPRD